MDDEARPRLDFRKQLHTVSSKEQTPEPQLHNHPLCSPFVGRCSWIYLRAQLLVVKVVVFPLYKTTTSHQCLPKQELEQRFSRVCHA